MGFGRETGYGYNMFSENKRKGQRKRMDENYWYSLIKDPQIRTCKKMTNITRNKKRN